MSARVCFYTADQNPERDRSRGITEYSSGLLCGLRDRGEFDLSVLASRSSYNGEAGIEEHLVPFRTDHTLGRLAADFLHPIWMPRAELVHYPKGFLPGLRPRRGVTCGTVHDTILQYYADHYPRSRSRLAFAYWLAVVRRSIPRFDVILTISEFSAQAIREFCARHRIACPPIRVTYLGCRWENSEAPALPKRDLVIHLGSREPHKGTTTLLRLWREVKRDDLKLIVVGSVDAESEREIVRTPGVEKSPFLAEPALKKLFSEARAVILPSEIEGFGLAALEGYAVGTPTVYVRGTTVEEVLGANAPGGFQLDEPESFRRALETVLDLGQEEIAAKRRELLSRLSWAECVRKTVAAYREFAPV